MQYVSEGNEPFEKGTSEKVPNNGCREKAISSQAGVRELTRLELHTIHTPHGTVFLISSV